MQTVAAEGCFKPNAYEGVRPVSCELTALFRPQLCGLVSKHYVSHAGKALPALVFGLCVTMGRVFSKRLGIPRLLLRRKEGETEAALQKRLIDAATETLAPQEAPITDAGFGLCALWETDDLCFVARVRKNQTARRNTLSAYGGGSRKPEWGEIVPSLGQRWAGKTIAAATPDETSAWENAKSRCASFYTCASPREVLKRLGVLTSF